MSNLSLLFSSILFFTASAIAFWSWASWRQNQRTLSRCSDLLQEIFSAAEERSAVNRILSQEAPDQELARLKALLENRSEAVLIENTALWSVLEGLPDGLVAIDAERNVIFCNTEACRLIGIPVEIQQGRKLFEILRHHLPLKLAENHLNSQATEMVETEFLNAEEKTVRMRIIRLQEPDAAEAIFVFSDMSALKKLENMRRDFVANVSHELRTPLTSIQGFAETLLDGAMEDSETRSRFLELIKKDADRLRRLIEDLLAFSKIENQSRNFEKQSIHLASEFDETIELFALRIEQKKICLEKEIEISLIISADRDQFRQVLVNLLDNAVKFTPDSGKISVVAKKLEKLVEIRIANSGPSIHPDNREKIFQRFFREDRARSRETGGTGLGLAIVKHIVEAHQGSVFCEENPTGGAVFVVIFPAV